MATEMKTVRKDMERILIDHKRLAEDLNNLKQHDCDSLKMFVQTMQNIQKDIVAEKRGNVEEQLKKRHTETDEKLMQAKQSLIEEKKLMNEKKTEIITIQKKINDYKNDNMHTQHQISQLEEATRAKSHNLSLKKQQRLVLMTETAEVEGNLYEKENMSHHMLNIQMREQNASQDESRKSFYSFRPGFSKSIPGRFISPLAKKHKPGALLNKLTPTTISPPKLSNRIQSPSTPQSFITQQNDGNEFLLDLND
ncbi:hypothetical protein GEMRC1_010364 [Eukaryota sp. GEM-RC1]